MAEPSSSNKKEDTSGRPRLLPDSYQGRYLLLAVLIALALLLVTWGGHQMVERVTNRQVARMEARARLQQHLDEALRRRDEVAAWLYRQLAEPGVRQPVSLENLLERFRAGLTALQDPELDDRRLDRLIDEQWQRLAEESRRLLTLSMDNQLRFPAARLMQDRMLPAAREFSTLVDAMIDELEESGGQSPLLLPLYRLRHTWQQILSDFRLLVANRFGVFADDPQRGMQARAANIGLHLHQLRSQLHRLTTAPQPPSGLYVAPESWQTLQKLLARWTRSYHQVVRALQNPEWRSDLALFKHRLAPLLGEIQSDLVALRNLLDTQAAADLQGLGGVARRLSLTLLVVALAAIALIWGAWFYLRQTILRPIAETTRALRREAVGIQDQRVPDSRVRETRDLVTAFEEMRREVARRRQHLDYLAHHDALTRLPNRVYFKDRLTRAINQARRNQGKVALLFLDLDNFKQINDSLGHQAGDDLLITVAGRLKKLLRSGDTVARLGGDEFAILLEKIEGKRQARAIARRILDTLGEPVQLQGQSFHLSASLGIAMAPHDDEDPDALIRDADSAMYEAKRRGKNAYHFFSAELVQRAASQLDLERELRRAIEAGEFLFHYQPIVHTRSHKIYTVEALIRWQPPDGPLRQPDQFIDTLLEIDQEQKVLRDLLGQVENFQNHCRETLGVTLPVSINLSASVLRNTATHEPLLGALRRHGRPGLLRIEITEDTLVEDLANAHVLLQELRRMGFPLVLDDFGTGQSSLNHLRAFPFDAIKIDKAFVLNLDENEEDAKLVNAIIRLAHGFDMKVVAEGVERREHQRRLARMRCDYLQGYLISKPVTQERLYAMLEKLRRRRDQAQPLKRRAS